MTTDTDGQKPREQKPAPVGHNSKHFPEALEDSARPSSTIQVLVEQVSIWPPLAERANDLTDFDLDAEVELLRTHGQRLPVVVRSQEDGRYEAILRPQLVTVLRAHNQHPGSNPLQLEVQIAKISDAQAFRCAAQELEPGPDVSPLARSRFYKEAVKAHRTQKDAANVCRISESAMSKSLDVGRAADVIGAKVLIARDIAQRDASWLMDLAGRDKKPAQEEEQAARALIRKTLDSIQPSHAKAVFATLRAAFKTPTEPKGRHSLSHEGAPIGYLIRSRKGLVKIELNAIGDVEPDAIGRLISEAIAQARQEAR